MEWQFRREGADDVSVHYHLADQLMVFRGWVEDGLETCGVIAKEMGVSDGTAFPNWPNVPYAPVGSGRARGGATILWHLPTSASHMLTIPPFPISMPGWGNGKRACPGHANTANSLAKRPVFGNPHGNETENLVHPRFRLPPAVHLVTGGRAAAPVSRRSLTKRDGGSRSRPGSTGSAGGFAFWMFKSLGELIKLSFRHAERQPCCAPMGEGASIFSKIPLARSTEIWK